MQQVTQICIAFIPSDFGDVSSSCVLKIEIKHDFSLLYTYNLTDLKEFVKKKDLPDLC